MSTFTLGVVLLIAAIELPSPREKWISIAVDGFLIYSNASERETKRITSDVLRMREAVGAVTTLKVRSATPIRMYIFRDDDDFAPYRAAVMGSNEQFKGMFIGRRDESFIGLTSDVGNNVGHLVYHELTHYFVNNTIPDLPLWFREGIAEYYSSFESAGDHVNIGRAIEAHVLFLRANPMLPLQQLFAVGSDSKEYNEGTRAGVIYAQSWALVHYLMSDARRRQQLSTYLRLIAEGRPDNDAFNTAFATTYANLESQLRSYVRRSLFAYSKIPVGDLPKTAVPPAVPMSRDDALARLGYLIAHTQRTNLPDAERFARAALEINPKNANAHALLGKARRLGGDFAAAEAAYESAAALNPKDPAIYIAYGELLGARGEAALARATVRKALDLDPSSPSALTLYGMTFAEEREPSEGIAALERSLALLPAQPDAMVVLVELYVNANRRNDAAKLTEGAIARTGDKALLSRARDAVLFADMREAEELYNAGKTEEAAIILRAVQSATTDDGMRSHASAMLARLEQRRALERRVNEAIDLANAGKMAQAMAVIDKLLPEIHDEELREQLLDLRAKFARRR